MDFCECGGKVIRCLSKVEGPVYACTKCEMLIDTLSQRLKREAYEAINDNHNKKAGREEG